jgi:uncharacterized protein (UPF0335 family)
MGRPKGSRNRPNNGDGEDRVELRNTVSGKELRGYLERIEYLGERQKEISSDRTQIFKELKAGGYDRDTVRAIVRRRKLTEEQRETADALMDQYQSALGDFADTPLGEAGAAGLLRRAAE